MDFEEVLNRIGGFGFFNKTVMLVALVLSSARTTMFYFSHLFVLISPPSQWCLQGNASATSVRNVSELPRGKCQMETEFPPGNGTARFYIGDGQSCSTGWLYDTNEVFFTATMENQWVCGDSWKMYTVHMAFWIGSMCGYIFCGFLADRIGRKKTILMLSVIGANANLASIFFTDLLSTVALRFFAGVGAVTLGSTVFVMVMEYAVTNKRTFITFIWAVTWTTTASIYPWYAYLIQSWRGLLITNASMDLTLFILLWWVPESSSWLWLTGKREEALDTLARIARFNGKVVSKEEIKHLMNGGLSGQALLSSSAPSVASLWETTVAIIKNPRIRRVTFFMFASWFVIVLCYNACTIELGRLNLDIYATYSVAMAFELPGDLFSILLLDKVGRRWPNVTFMFLGGVVSLLMAMLRTGNELLAMAMAVLMYMSFAGSFMITYQVASELFPTVIRGRAVLLKNVFGSFGALLGIRVASLTEIDTHLPVLVTGLAALVGSGLLFFLPDTVGQALPQTIEDGEDYARGQSICFCPLFASKATQKLPEMEGGEMNKIKSINT